MTGAGKCGGKPGNGVSGSFRRRFELGFWPLGADYPAWKLRRDILENSNISIVDDMLARKPEI